MIALPIFCVRKVVHLCARDGRDVLRMCLYCQCVLQQSNVSFAAAFHSVIVK